MRRANVVQQIENKGGADDSMWKHFVGGAVAGAVSRTLTAPLDRLKVMAQVTGKSINPVEGISMMYKEGGMVSMWRGNGINVIKIAPENALKFLVYDELKKLYLKDRSDAMISDIDRIISAGTAGVVAHIAIFPLEVVKTRMVLQTSDTRSTFLKTFVDGVKLNGFQMLFKGFVPSLLGIFAFCAADLSSYEGMKKFYLKHYSPGSHVASIPLIVLFGSFSSLFGNLFSYPLSMVATYLQSADHPGMTSMQAARIFLYKRLHDDGIIGLYKGGMLASLKTVPSIAITYAVYEKMLHILNAKMTS